VGHLIEIILLMRYSTNHFFIEIAEQNKSFVLKAGVFQLDEKGRFKKRFLTENETDFTNFLLIFQETYTLKSLENKVDILFYIHGFWSGSNAQTEKNIKRFNNFYTQDPASSIALTVSLIWYSGYSSYFLTRRLCKKRAVAFAPNFWNILLETKEILGKTGKNGKNHLVCHSMGNYFLENILPFKPVSKQPLFQELVMAAADVGDCFYEKQQAYLHNLSERILVLNNKKDRSLSISKWLNRQTRLGKHPPQYFSEKYASVYATEVSGVKDVKNKVGLLNQHQHHQVSTTVKFYLRDVFNGKKTVEILTN
jgi:ribosomal protein L31